MKRHTEGGSGSGRGKGIGGMACHVMSGQGRGTAGTRHVTASEGKSTGSGMAGAASSTAHARTFA